MANRLNKLFSPDRLNAKWDGSEEESTKKKTLQSEDIEQESLYNPSQNIPDSWVKCQELFHEEFELKAGLPELIQGITLQFQKLLQQSEPIGTEEKSQLKADLGLFERLAEVQIITGHNPLAMNY
jgi:hypothetical protein